MALNPQRSLEGKKTHPKKNLDHLKWPLHYETTAFLRANSKAIFNEPILPFIMSSFEYQNPYIINQTCLQCYYYCFVWTAPLIPKQLAISTAGPGVSSWAAQHHWSLRPGASSRRGGKGCPAFPSSALPGHSTHTREEPDISNPAQSKKELKALLAGGGF